MRNWALVTILAFLSACSEPPTALEPSYHKALPSSQKILRFAVHPLHNPDRLVGVFGPLVTYINQRVPGQVMQLEASLNYAAFEEKLKKRELDFALPNPYQTLMSLQYGYRVIAKMGDDENFRGIIVVRKDSGIKTLADLKGKQISFPAPTALAATMMPQYFLFQHGIDVLHEIKNIYVGSQESSIMNVYLKNTSAGGTWPPPWNAFKQNNPEKAKHLEVRWETEPLPNNGFVVKDDIPSEIVASVRNALLALSESKEGQKILSEIGVSKFESATEENYDLVKKFLQQFKMNIRDPEGEK